MSQPNRVRMSDDCETIRHKFSVGGHEGYLHIGLYPNGQPGEIFIRMAKEGSTLSGLMDTIAVGTSLCLQFGVPLESMVRKFMHTRFEPSGLTSNLDIPVASSVADYVFRFLGKQYANMDINAMEKEDAPSIMEEGV